MASTGASSSTPRGNDPRATPAMRQYARFKKAHPDCVLFFRMGDFYEMFDDDAITAHRALGITLTERTKGVPMAGVPYHAVENYLRRMVEQGYRVAVCEQVEDPSQAKGVVERAVARVVTPGTLVDESLLDEGRANQIAAIVIDDANDTGSAAAVAVIELSTGAFTLHRVAAGRLVDELARLQPDELLYSRTNTDDTPPVLETLRSATGCALTPVAPWLFRPVESSECLREHFGVATLDGFGLAHELTLTAAAGALLRHLRDLHAAGEMKCPLRHIRPPLVIDDGATLAIDATSLRSLEIERTMRSGDVAGSVLATFERCCTPMGRRLLRQWLCFPLRERTAIEARQRCVAALVEDDALRDALVARLSSVQDVARIAARVAMGRATPRDVVALGRSIGGVGALAALLEARPAFAPHHDRLRGLAATLEPLAAHIVAACVDDAPPHLREGGLFRDGVDAELDEARSLQRDGGAWLAGYQQELVERTGIPSLKVGYNRVFGYYIEVTNAHASKVPPDFVRRQTLRGAERYITDALKSYETRATSAEARALQRERELFDALCAEVGRAGAAAAVFAEVIAVLDVLLSFAMTARRSGYCRPAIADEPVIEIVDGRHPVLDRLLGTSFVPNDCRLRMPRPSDAMDDASNTPGERVVDTASVDPGAGASLALITGPNMAGKSTYIRQVALIALLAHTGSFVPARTATIGLADRIFTRIGASDELHAGQSTFMVEMTETANILHHATGRSIVILDEIGRGTSTLDGLSLAWAIAESLAERRCRTLFATHYHELTGLADRLDSVTNLHVAVREWGDEVVFLHRILPGRADRSYGIHVARLAGLPRDTIARAETLLATLEVQTEPQRLPRPDERPGPAPGEQLGLFVEYMDHPVVNRLRELRLETLTPLEAFDTLRRLVDEVRHGKTAGGG